MNSRRRTRAAGTQRTGEVRPAADRPLVFQVNPAQLPAISDVEAAFGTTRLLPPENVIPEAFWRGNLYTRVAECRFYGRMVPDAHMQLRDGVSAPQMVRMVDAHLRSFEPKHEHKIAGVGYLMSLLCTLTPVDDHSSGAGHG